MPDIQFEIKKVQRSIKECAKSGNIGAAKIARLVFPTPCLMPMPTSAAVQEVRRLAVRRLGVLAKEIVRSNKAITRLTTNKAHMMSISNSLTEQLGEEWCIFSVLTADRLV
eukprot:scaffold31198_cov21-Tisochrysis_lutea.AAC.1